ncbi:hypothetical protein [Bacillus cereus group sp. BfR-BA-01380]|uniref:hypothetical protein n=1 Tax=Bacillus cereus group sp. BfR-BA-01380 TaxID=2920324 RepID=UPI001F563546|nr:hypothetical protein [Bacillus cereus group sp. BfR-BA-01380]
MFNGIRHVHIESSYQFTFLCVRSIFVSRSGYYAWLHQTDKHMEKERNDEKDYEWIQEIFNRKEKKWLRCNTGTIFVPSP